MSYSKLILIMSWPNRNKESWSLSWDSMKNSKLKPGVVNPLRKRIRNQKAIKSSSKTIRLGVKVYLKWMNRMLKCFILVTMINQGSGIQLLVIVFELGLLENKEWILVQMKVAVSIVLREVVKLKTSLVFLLILTMEN